MDTMKNEWTKIIGNYHKRNYKAEAGELIIGGPASEESINSLEMELQCKLPSEVKNCYRECDGFGFKRDGEINWFLKPIGGISKTTSSARDWFEETHPALAKKFVAFIDWGNGDYSGGLLGDSGSLSDILYMFDHEAYEYDEDQNPAEFLKPEAKSLGDMFK